MAREGGRLVPGDALVGLRPEDPAGERSGELVPPEEQKQGQELIVTFVQIDALQEVLEKLRSKETPQEKKLGWLPSVGTAAPADL